MANRNRQVLLAVQVGHRAPVGAQSQVTGRYHRREERQQQLLPRPLVQAQRFLL